MKIIKCLVKIIIIKFNKIKVLGKEKLICLRFFLFLIVKEKIEILFFFLIFLRVDCNS